jgi:hypothetical protein
VIAFGYGHSFLTYLWHYVLARLVYDDLVRPLTRGGDVPVLLPVACIVLVAFLLGRRAGARRTFDRRSAGRRP